MITRRSPYQKKLEAVITALSYERAYWDNPQTTLNYHYRNKLHRIIQNQEDVAMRIEKVYVLDVFLNQLVTRPHKFEDITIIETVLGDVEIMTQKLTSNNHMVYVSYRKQQLFRFKTDNLTSHSLSEKIARATVRKAARYTKPYWINSCRNAIGNAP